MNYESALLVSDEFDRILVELRSISSNPSCAQVQEEIISLKLNLFKNSLQFSKVLSPFQKIITDKQTTDYITSLALSSVNTFISFNLLKDSKDAETICNTIKNCQFQSTSDFDRLTVSYRILSCMTSLCKTNLLNSYCLSVMIDYIITEINNSDKSLSSFLIDSLSFVSTYIFRNNITSDLLLEKLLTNLYFLCQKDFSCHYGLYCLLQISRVNSGLNDSLMAVTCSLFHKIISSSVNNKDDFVLILRLFTHLFIDNYMIYPLPFSKCFYELLCFIEPINQGAIQQNSSAQNLALNHQLKTAALEIVYDFTMHPNFLLNLFVNLNARTYFPDLFDKLIKILFANSENNKFFTLVLPDINILANDKNNFLFNKEEIIQNFKSESDHFKELTEFSNKFNDSPSYCMNLYTPYQVAHYFFEAPNLSRKIIGEFFGKNKSFCMDTLQEYLECLDFSNLDFDSSIRFFLSGFQIAGEGQIVDRIFEYFSKRFFTCGSDRVHFNSIEAVHILSYGWLMIHTSFHNNNVTKKPDFDEFVQMMANQNNGENFDEDFLREIFQSVKNAKVPFEDSEQGGSVAHWRLLLCKQKQIQFKFVNFSNVEKIHTSENADENDKNENEVHEKNNSLPYLENSKSNDSLESNNESKNEIRSSEKNPKINSKCNEIEIDINVQSSKDVNETKNLNEMSDEEDLNIAFLLGDDDDKAVEDKESLASSKQEALLESQSEIHNELQDAESSRDIKYEPPQKEGNSFSMSDAAATEQPALNSGPGKEDTAEKSSADGRESPNLVCEQKIDISNECIDRNCMLHDEIIQSSSPAKDMECTKDESHCSIPDTVKILFSCESEFDDSSDLFLIVREMILRVWKLESAKITDLCISNLQSFHHICFLASKFHMFEIVENFVILFSKNAIEELLESSKEPKSIGENSNLFLLGYMIKNYCKSIRKDGWRSYIKLLCTLFELDLLNDEILTFKNIAEDMNPVVLCHKLISRKNRKNSMFSLFMSRKSSKDNLRRTSSSSNLKDFVLKSEIEKFIENNSSKDSLIALIEAIVSVSHEVQLTTETDQMRIAFCAILIEKIFTDKKQKVSFFTSDNNIMNFVTDNFFVYFLNRKSDSFLPTLLLNEAFVISIELWSIDSLEDNLIYFIDKISMTTQIMQVEVQVDMIEKCLSLFFDKHFESFIQRQHFRGLLNLIQVGILQDSPQSFLLLDRFKDISEGEFENVRFPLIQARVSVILVNNQKVVKDNSKPKNSSRTRNEDDVKKRSFSEVKPLIFIKKTSDKQWESLFNEVLFPLTTKKVDYDDLLLMILETFEFAVAKLRELPLFEPMWFRLLSLTLDFCRRCGDEVKSQVEARLGGCIAQMKRLAIFNNANSKIWNLTKSNVEKVFPSLI